MTDDLKMWDVTISVGVLRKPGRTQQRLLIEARDEAHVRQLAEKARAHVAAVARLESLDVRIESIAESQAGVWKPG